MATFKFLIRNEDGLIKSADFEVFVKIPIATASSLQTGGLPAANTWQKLVNFNNLFDFTAPFPASGATPANTFKLKLKIKTKTADADGEKDESNIIKIDVPVSTDVNYIYSFNLSLIDLTNIPTNEFKYLDIREIDFQRGAGSSIVIGAGMP